MLLLSFQVYSVSRAYTKQSESASNVFLNQASRNLDLLLDQVNQISLQISFNPDILELLTRPFDQPPWQYAAVREQLRSLVSFNPLFQSLYLEILQNRRVLTTSEGIYDFPNFYDRTFLEQMEALRLPSVSPWIGVQTVRDTNSNQSSEVIAITKSIPATQVNPLGILVLNLQKNIFLDTLLTLHGEAPGRLYLYDPENQPISEPVPDLKTDDILRTIAPGTVYTETIQASDKKSRLYAVKLPSNGCTLILLSSFDGYNQQLESALKRAVAVLLAVAAAGVALSYLFSTIMYDPWRRLAERLQGFVQKQPADRQDAYAFVDNAIHLLIAAVRKNEPIVRDHCIHELLHDHIPGAEEASDRLKEVGLRFSSPHFAVLVVSCEGMDERDHPANRLLYLYTIAEESLVKRFPSAGTILDRSRFGFILNIDSEGLDDALRTQLVNCCRHIRDSADERFQAGLSFCISGIHPLDKLHSAYEQVKRTMAYKAFMPSDIYFAEQTGESSDLTYPAIYQKYILNAILTEDRDAAESYVTKLFDDYLDMSSHTYPMLLQMIIMLMSHVLASLVQEGFEIGPLMNEVDLLKLQHCQNRLELRRLILNQIDHVIAYLESSREKAEGYTSSVQQAIEYILQHYSTAISISDIAEAIGISAPHLSRVFKAEVGKTPLEYLTDIRLTVSKQLLKDHNRPLKHIIEMVGYNDVHSYIRLFKKAEGTTPGEYRKRIMNRF
jgi:AraC-like DNA-binding protein